MNRLFKILVRVLLVIVILLTAAAGALFIIYYWNLDQKLPGLIYKVNGHFSGMKHRKNGSDGAL